jgi:hypothetical protein
MAVDGVLVEKWVRYLVVKKPTTVADSPFLVTEIMSGIDDRRTSGEHSIFSEIQRNRCVLNCALSVCNFLSTPV